MPPAGALRGPAGGTDPARFAHREDQGPGAGAPMGRKARINDTARMPPLSTRSAVSYSPLRIRGCATLATASPIEAITRVRSGCLIAEDNQYLRKLIRNLLVNIGHQADRRGRHERPRRFLRPSRISSPICMILDCRNCRCSTAPSWCGSCRTPGMLARPAMPIIMFRGDGQALAHRGSQAARRQRLPDHARSPPRPCSTASCRWSPSRAPPPSRKPPSSRRASLSRIRSCS